MSIVIVKSTHEKKSYQPLETKNKLFEVAITFLTCYISMFNVTNRNNQFYSTQSISDAGLFLTKKTKNLQGLTSLKV